MFGLELARADGENPGVSKVVDAVQGDSHVQLGGAARMPPTAQKISSACIT